MPEASAAPPALPLSAAQYGIWTGQQIDPLSPAFNTAEYVTIHGPADVPGLAAAIRATVGETEALQMRFAERDGIPHQIPATPDCPVHIADLRNEPNPFATAEAWMHRDIARPVDLATGQLFAHALFVTGERTVLWYHRVHHILLDGYGLALFAQRVAARYTAAREEREPGPAPWASLSALLAEDAGYQHGADHERDRAHWVGYHRDRPAPVTLAGRSAPLARHVHRVTAEIPALSTEGLRTVAREARANWTDALIAAIATYLHRMTGAPHVSLALPVMLRTGSVAVRVPAMVTNVVQCYTDFTDEPSLVDLIGQVRDHLRASRPHHRYRYEELRRDLGLVGNERKLFGPSANIMPFDYGLRFGSFTSSVRNVSAGLVEDLAVNVYDRADGDGLLIALDANPNLYDTHQLEGHLTRFLTLLERLIAAPHQQVAAHDLLLPHERRLLEAEAHGTAISWDDQPAGTIAELLANRTATSPDAPALVSADGTLSYAELSDRVRRLAAVLTEHGVGPGDVVLHLLPRTSDAIIALFAIGHAGAAYLPADPDHPPARIAQLMDDATPVTVLTTTAYTSLLPAGAATITLDSPETMSRLAAARGDDQPVPLDPGAPLCLIYTSGSTGTPKGAWTTHRGMVNLFHHHRTTMIEPACGTTPRRAALTASLSFDTSWEGLLWLLAGHELHLVDDDTRRDPAALLDYIDDHTIDFLDITPTYATELLAAGLLDHHRHRPAVLALGGEAAGPALWTALRGAPEITTYNLYGPTECTVDATWARLADSPTPVIGRPVSNARGEVLDAALQRLPPGVTGELYLGGVPVGAGYHRRPELTAERFVRDPYGPPGARMYRTGDLARRLPDGQLEYLGRADDQMKVRGFRIEPGEIEAALQRHSHVRQAAVIARDDRLIAYVVCEDTDATPAGGELRAHTAALLPEHMVPATTVFLDRLPVQVSGKLDRAALPDPPAQQVTEGREPRTAEERKLCALFRSVLGLTAADLDTDFFSAGGHSLLVARLIGLIRTEFGVRLTVRDVFEASTVATLAARINAPTTHHPWAGTDLTAEVTLPEDIRPNGTPQPARAVFLTGATGFLGAFLLRELLDRTPLRVHCLVRARSAVDGIDRLRAALDAYGLGDQDMERVTAHPGDLEEPHLGLAPAEFARLANTVDVILHNGARVNHFEPYQRLRASHVGGTTEILRLATTGAPKPVHHVSTCDTALPRIGIPENIGEADRVTERELALNGYVGAKWVSEGLLVLAAERGLPIAVHRPSRILGDSRTGAAGTDDAFWSLVRAMAVLRAAPADTELGVINAVPADWAAACVVRLLKEDRTGPTYHLTAERHLPVAEVVERLRARGHRLEPLPTQAWTALLTDRAATGEDPLLSIAASHWSGAAGASTPPAFHRKTLDAALPGELLAGSDITPAVIDRYLDHLTTVGFLPAPRPKDTA
ncbi:non-ribosomal peptide synthetase [Streptomyces sp. NRRL F-2890]|uniref:non-ribosomal peptide synthetase n=1 Tax=Streptomyces sp. NRRL F-2890 TaxID=1463845 RepID=UPI000693E0E2|nr:non-ribosomal peptide synthetase [Streptomyces sp. NRRL F-2890]